MTERIDAIVLAAGSMPDDLRRHTGAEARGLIRVGGIPVIDRVLEAVGTARTVGGSVVVCAPGSPLLAHVGDRAVASAGPGFIDSIRTGLAALGGPERALIVTGDLPLLTAASVDHFSREALQSDASIVYSVITRQDCERVFPGGRRTFVRLVDGVFTGGNVAAVSRQFIEMHGDRLAAAFASRKHPLRLCALLGWGFVVRLLLGRLSLADIIRRAEGLLGADMRVVVSPYAEVGFDVDKPSNLETVEAWLRDHTP